ncbi:MAG: hypothetical protein WBD01_11405, partial [Salaquimonas sp.]
MEQLDQLRTMRDQAAIRLEEARAALEKSPDAKLVSSLSTLIADLENALGLAPAPILQEPAPVVDVAPAAEEVPIELPAEEP